MNTNKEVSVKQALERGRKMLKLPSTIVPKLIIGLMILLAFFKLIAWQYALFSVPLSLFLFPLFYRSYRVTKWKLWAYEHTRNVHELKAKAVMLGIISEDVGFMERLFRTSAEKKKLEELQKKFQIPDLLKNRPEFPEETVLYYSQRHYLLAILFFSLGGLVSILSFLKKQNGFSLVVLITSICFVIINLTKRRKNEPGLILSDKGIKTFNRPFASWAEISNEKVIRGKVDDSDEFYFVFNDTSGEESIGIDRLSIKPLELFDLLIVYRRRFEEQRDELVE
jgi:hypothetical protein